MSSVACRYVSFFLLVYVMFTLILSKSVREIPNAEIKVSKLRNSPNKEAMFMLSCIVTYGERESKEGVTWTDENNKQLSSNRYVKISLKNGSRQLVCNYKIGDLTGTKNITMAAYPSIPGESHTILLFHF